jgi:hypothetical protein
MSSLCNLQSNYANTPNNHFADAYITCCWATDLPEPEAVVTGYVQQFIEDVIIPVTAENWWLSIQHLGLAFPVQNNWSAIASPLHFLNKMSNQDMTASPFRGGPLGQEWHQHLLHQHLPMCKHLLLHHHLTMCKLLLLPHHRQLYFL